MQRITYDGHTCLYLDHQQLLTQSYKEAVGKDSECYTLKSNLFDFKSQRRFHPKDEEEDGVRIRKRKRRRKIISTEKVEKDEEHLHSRTFLQPFLDHIRKFISSRKMDKEQITRYWEERYEVPQLHGINETECFQYVKTLQKGVEFLIPPFTRFFNGDLRCQEKSDVIIGDDDVYQATFWPNIAKDQYDLIIMDMPWRNKYIRRLKKVANSLAYKMLDNQSLERIPIEHLTHPYTLVALWCTNSQQHQKILLERFLPKWKLTLIHQLKWFKLNNDGELIVGDRYHLDDDDDGYSSSRKKPYEMLYLACHQDRPNLEQDSNIQALKEIEFLISIPSLIHSHKPPINEWLKDYIHRKDDVKRCHWQGLEIFARYLQPHFTSIGLEVLKLMDSRLYCKIPTKIDG